MKNSPIGETNDKEKDSIEVEDDDDDDDDDDIEIATAYKNFMIFVITTLVQQNYTDLPDDFDDKLELTVNVIIKMQVEISEVCYYFNYNIRIKHI